MTTITHTPVAFSDVKVGDRLRFLTNDTGYGGSGEIVAITATVVKITPKTVRMDGGLYSRKAVLRASEWNHREPLKVTDLSEFKAGDTVEAQYRRRSSGRDLGNGTVVVTLDRTPWIVNPEIGLATLCGTKVSGGTPPIAVLAATVRLVSKDPMRTATVADVITRMQAKPVYQAYDVAMMGWGMGEAQYGIRAAVLAAHDLGLVTVWRETATWKEFASLTDAGKAWSAQPVV